MSEKQELFVKWVNFKTEIRERRMFDYFVRCKRGILCEVIGEVAFNFPCNFSQRCICNDEVRTFKKAVEINYSFLCNRIERLLRYYISVYLVEDLNVYLFKEEWITDILKTIDVNDLSITLESIIDKTNKFIEEKRNENPDFCKL